MNVKHLVLLIPVISLFMFCSIPDDVLPDYQLGIFDNSIDIGEVKHAGSVEYNHETEEYMITGSGFNMWAETDEMHFLWKAVQGDFILRAEIEFVGEGVDPHRKVGWAVRNNLSSHSAMVNGTVHGDGLVSLQYRKEFNGPTEETVSKDSSANVIQLARIGDTYIFSTAKKGNPFSVVQTSEVNLKNEVLAGIYVCAHNPDVIEQAKFRNVRIIKPAPEDLIQYQQYLGSRMEILNIETGNRTVLFESEHSIQAPNWTVDGESLIYNSNGYLYTYHFEKEKIELLNSGFAVNNNNDHVLSFDGKLLGISNHNPDDDNNSTIYILPSNGSDSLKQVTKSGIGASYLHGISPDNSRVAFTGFRNGKYDIYSADINTMEEIQLTDTPGLDDGSEYSPDGKYIYFNSDRTGAMQIWRMDADGSNETQLTFDEEFNDWFPHISPDGKWIAFISFGTDVEPSQHPFYKEVMLRLMPIEGGEPTIIAYVYGGQGTMNVPSWSPDSKKIAFVSNSGTYY
ncbi:MAG: biopolymer transporter TolR [Balneola sp.]|nr:MAG: biopolymer transporter TolR [Balneola sp.]